MKNQTIHLTEPIQSQRNLPALGDVDLIQHLEIWFAPHVTFNSFGIRDWMRWLQPLSEKENVIIELYECPESVIQLINMISGFLPRNGEVVSFYVSYYSEETDESKKVLFTRGHQYLEDKVILPQVKDSKGHPMQIDVDQGKFFKFLKSNPLRKS